MSSRTLHPKWWQMYLALPALVALFILEARLKISTGEHQILQIGIVLLVYGLMYAWLKANRSALSRMDQEQAYGRGTVLRAPFSKLSASDKENRPTFQLPDPEVKGMLSDTFEMGYIDRVAFPVDEVSQKSK